MAISGAFMAQFRPNLAGTLNQALHTTSDQSWPESANTQIWPVPVTLGGCGSKFAHVSSISAQLFARIDPHLGRCRLNMARLCSTSPPQTLARVGRIWPECHRSRPNFGPFGPGFRHLLVDWGDLGRTMENVGPHPPNPPGRPSGTMLGQGSAGLREQTSHDAPNTPLFSTNRVGELLSGHAAELLRLVEGNALQALSVARHLHAFRARQVQRDLAHTL